MGANGSHLGTMFITSTRSRTGARPNGRPTRWWPSCSGSSPRRSKRPRHGVWPRPGPRPGRRRRIPSDDRRPRRRGRRALQDADRQVRRSRGTQQRRAWSDLNTVFRANTPQLYVDIDRTKCKTMGVPLSDVFDALQVELGGLYVNDFNQFGRTFQVNAQADVPFRMQPEDLRRLYVRNGNGGMVPLATVADRRGPRRPVRHQPLQHVPRRRRQRRARCPA